MVYNVNYTDDTKAALIVDDGSVNTQTSISLVGKKYARYGEAISENFLHLLENFANDTEPTNPTEGQFWYDNINDRMKFFTSNNGWKSLSGLFTTDTTPPVVDSVVGDFWVNPANSKISYYVNGSWIELGKTQVIITEGGSSTPTDPTDPTDPIPSTPTTITNGISSKTRYDSTGALHKTLEFIVNSKTVSIMSSDDVAWIPASVGVNAEFIEGSNSILLSSQFPTIKKGININPSGTAKYNVHNLTIDRLGQLSINVGRGDVTLENNAYDNYDGAGITLRTQSNPVNGSIFSVRSAGNANRLWVGQSHTSMGSNPLYVGFTGSIGQENDIQQYNIKLGLTGEISAKTVTGDWVSTLAEANAGIINNKLMTPYLTKQAIQSYSYVPAGAIMAFAMNSAPSGWLKCDGSLVLRSTYQALFLAIGTTYGIGNGTTTFKLPDYRGVFLRGIDDGKGLDNNRQFGNYQSDELKAHTHNVSYMNRASGSEIDNQTPVLLAETAYSIVSGQTSTNATTGVETRPKNYSVLYCIKS